MSTAAYGQLVRAAAADLHAAGVDDPAGEARRLMLWASGFSAIELISSELDPVTADHQSAFQLGVRHRQARKPLAHLTGQVDFYNLTLRTDPRALIPRRDSECVVDLALEYLPAGTTARIADLGTGTGALLIALLSARPGLQGEAIEQAPEACDLAIENIWASGLQDRTILVRKSWSDWTGWGAADLIIANPPYIASGILPALAPEVREHDPVSALDGGADGLDAYREIITLAAQMRPGTHLVLEIGYDQRAAVTALLQATCFTSITHRKDLANHDRAIAATRA